MPSTGEWVMILFVGIMIYGRRLPEVGRQVGRTVANLRRGFEDFRRELDRDESLREVRSGVRDMRSALDAPRHALDPKRLVDHVMADDHPEHRDDGDPVDSHEAVIQAESQRLAAERAAIEGHEPATEPSNDEPAGERERRAEAPGSGPTASSDPPPPRD
jgi:Sec-independent protein translocase protein TatA